MEETADVVEVLAGRESLLHRRVLASQTDATADRVRIGDDIDAVDARLTRIRGKQCGEHPHRGGLARAVRAKQAVDRAGGNGKVDPIEGECLAEALHHTAHLDGGSR